MKRALALLLLSLLAGVLVAQDGNDTLRERVRAMRAELEELARASALPSDEVHYYDVAELMFASPGSVDEPRDLYHSYQIPSLEAESAEPIETWRRETLVELVEEVVGLNADLELRSGILRVRGGAQMHQRVEQLLRSLAQRRSDRFVVEVRIVPAAEGDEAALADVRRVIPEAVLETLTARDVLAAARVECTNGTEQRLSSLRQSRYVAEYDVEITRDARLGDPRLGTISEGLSGDLLLCMDRRANGVLAHIRLNWQRRSASPRSVDTQHGALTLPSLDVVRLATSAWLPLDRSVLLATCTRGVTPCHVILRVRRIE